MSPKKGYTEMGECFYLGIHMKCAGPVTFTLLTCYSISKEVKVIEQWNLVS